MDLGAENAQLRWSWSADFNSIPHTRGVGILNSRLRLDISIVQCRICRIADFEKNLKGLYQVASRKVPFQKEKKNKKQKQNANYALTLRPGQFVLKRHLD